MARHSGRLIGKLSSFVGAGVLFAAAVGVGFIPYFEQGHQACPSAIMGLAGQRTSSQAWYNMLSGGQCNIFSTVMFILMAVLLILTATALVSAIKLGKRRVAAGAPGRYQDAAPGAAAAGAPAQPGYAPAARKLPGIQDKVKNWDPEYKTWTGEQAPWQAEGKTPPAGGFDAKLAVVTVSAVAGIVVVSFLIDWLSFLPGIVELLLWAAVGLTVIWQLKRRAAGADPGELAAAEAWNPAVVARSVVADARHRLEIHRARRRETERAQAAAAPVAPQFTGDDRMVHPGQP